MPDQRVEFGWVVQPSPHSVTTDPASKTLVADNHRFLGLVRNHFQSAWLEDHFQWIGAQGSRDTLEVWTHLCYLMPQYPELLFGTLVLGQSYRNPALLAKMSASLQYLSGGRFILGIGAGWKEDEYRAYGWDYPAPGVRTRQLDEYTQIIKLMLLKSPVSYDGKHYSIKDAHNDPLPGDAIPLMIGGTGERGTLRTTAKYADWWNFPWRSVEEFGQKVAVLKQHCAEVGRDFDEIVLTTCQFVSLSNDPTKTTQAAGNFPVLGGNPDELTRKLEAFVTAGSRHFMIRFRDFPSTEGVELFLDKVLPRFQ